jgi:parvulin-like peptidyl-prolyl isomerase
LAKKKKRVEKPRHEPTKRQLSRAKQHQRRQRFIFGSGILIIVAVLAVIGAGTYFGWYVPERQPLHQTVIRVNDTEFSMDYYVKAIKFQIPALESQLANIGIQMDVSYVASLANSMVTAIETNELVRQGAQELGITVSDEEVEAAIGEQFASYDPSLLKTYHDVIRDMVRAQLLRQKLLAEYFDQQVPKTAEQRDIMAMFLESQSQANEIRDRLEGGELFSDLTAQFCLDSYCKSKDGDLGWHPQEILAKLVNSSVLVDSAFSQEVGTLSQPVPEVDKLKALGYWLIKLEFRDQDAGIVQGKAMLLGSEEEASNIRARLEAGEDFAALSDEFSQYDDFKANGGQFEVSQGDIGSAFDDFAFDPELELGTLSQPIKDDTVTTTGGYWLIKVADASSDRPIDETDRGTLKNDLFSQWVKGLSDNPDNTVESYLNDETTNWAVLHAWEG